MSSTDPTSRQPGELTSELRRAEEVTRRLTFTDLSFEIRLGHHLGYLRAMAAPRVAALLGRAGQIDAEPHRRATDTALFIWELVHHGLDSPEGRTVVDRVNAMHARYAIHPDDYQWVLCTFVVPGLQLIDRYGWRPLTAEERQALVDWWSEVGVRMGVPAMPATPDGWVDLAAEYERRHLAPSASGRRLFRATLDVALTPVPRLLRPLVVRTGTALFDPPARHALGLREPGLLSRALVTATLRGRAARRRRRGPGEPWFTPGAPHGDYPAGYTLDDLGPRDPAPADGRAGSPAGDDQAR